MSANEIEQQNPLRVAVLVGSVRQGRFAPIVKRWFLEQAAQRADMTFDVIDLAEVRLPDRISDPPPGAVIELGSRLEAAGAFVIITPEYNHSFPAALKSAIDWFRAEWRRKPVAFVSYGGISGGIRAVEQLRPVFAELEAVTIRDAVSFHRAHAAFDSEGNPHESNRVNRGAATMLDQLFWWGSLLRDGRSKDRAASVLQAAS